jgi:AraC-like DNA-binding protein
MCGYDYAVAEYTVLPHTDVQLGAESDGPLLLFFVVLEGTMLQRDKDGSLFERLQRFQWNIMFRPVLGERLIFRKNERHRILVIHFELQYLMQWKGVNALLDRFFFRSYAGVPASLSNRRPAPVKMLAAIERIAPAQGVYPDQMFREVRVLEVLFHAVESLLRGRPVRHRELHDADVRKLRLAQGYIIDHLGQAVTLQSLAHALGINVRKLKLGFPYAYGVTFYTLLTAARMERAGVLLERDHTIREICDQVGYRSLSHFAEAFRKYFGYPPERRRRD